VVLFAMIKAALPEETGSLSRRRGPRRHAGAKALTQEDASPPERRHTMGDKGGKKDKDKSQKQVQQKRSDKAREKKDKQRPSTS